MGYLPEGVLASAIKAALAPRDPHWEERLIEKLLAAMERAEVAAKAAAAEHERQFAYKPRLPGDLLHSGLRLLKYLPRPEIGYAAHEGDRLWLGAKAPEFAIVVRGKEHDIVLPSGQVVQSGLRSHVAVAKIVGMIRFKARPRQAFQPLLGRPMTRRPKRPAKPTVPPWMTPEHDAEILAALARLEALGTEEGWQ